MEFCILTYSRSRNLGDDIQSIAASQFLPHVDFHVDRDNLQRSASQKPIVVIFNGWFLHRFSPWPPPENIHPVYFGFHAARPKRLLAEQHLNHFRQHAPIGCRDPQTASELCARGIKAYWSGCLTLALQRPAGQRTNHIVSCDVDEAILEQLLPRSLEERLIRVSHRVSKVRRGNSEWKLAEARARLSLYGTAAFVMTTRLHVALPCIAFGTPVVVLKTPEIEQSPRWSGWRDSVPMIATHANWPWDRIEEHGQSAQRLELFPGIADDIRTSISRVLESNCRASADCH